MFIRTLFTKLDLGQRKLLLGERLKQLGQLALKREIIQKNEKKKKKVGRYKKIQLCLFSDYMNKEKFNQTTRRQI